MRITLVFLTLGCAAACASTASRPATTGLEALVICDKSSEAMEAAKGVAESLGFKVDPDNQNFSVPTESTQVFGFETRYVGLRGVMLQPGPNVTVVASVQELKTAVSAATGRPFECGKIGCWNKLSKQEAIIIYPYATDPTLATLQCGYYGQ